MLDIKEYENMAMFDLPEAERGIIGGRFEALVDSLAALERISTDDVEPLVTVLDIKNILREDISEKLLTRDELLSNAPEHYNGYFKVPGTLE